MFHLQNGFARVAKREFLFLNYIIGIKIVKLKIQRLQRGTLKHVPCLNERTTAQYALNWGMGHHVHVLYGHGVRTIRRRTIRRRTIRRRTIRRDNSSRTIRRKVNIINFIENSASSQPYFLTSRFHFSNIFSSIPLPFQQYFFINTASISATFICHQIYFYNLVIVYNCRPI